MEINVVFLCSKYNFINNVLVILMVFIRIYFKLKFRKFYAYKKKI